MEQRCTHWMLAGAMAVGLAMPPGSPAQAQAPEAAPSAATAFVIEYYYKVKWGHFDEFLGLYKKNHYPILERERQLGRIVRLEAAQPRYHGTEAERWDFRVTIAWKDAATAHDEFDPSRLVAELYPDEKTFEQEEQRRFELLLAHWDVPVNDTRLDK